MNYKKMIFRLLLSLILSSLIGMDRESTKKPAGLRTHILVSLGSTLVMLLSIYLHEMFAEGSAYYSDRLTAQVISGIGFLGAGTILHRDGGIVTGLTTAASLWVVACIGLAVGAGFYLGAAITTLLVIITLISFHRVSKKIKIKGQIVFITIISLDQPGQVGKIGQVIGDYGVNIINIDLEHKEEELIKINLELNIINPMIKYELLSTLSKIDNVLEISQRE